MKVILAGLPKTGTKTMTFALRELGYTVYDLMEHYQYHREEWLKILTKGGSSSDFMEMYENVDVVADLPACGLWQEILKAFPDAKVILTTRENEDIWLKSWLNQINEQVSWFGLFTSTLCPTIRRFEKLLEIAAQAYSGINLAMVPSFPYPVRKRNDMLTKYWYRRHNAHVIQDVPREQLLIFDLKSGWEPLCKFLNKPVPDKPFPHLNKNGVLLKTLADHPVVKQMAKEINILVAMVASTCVVSLITYRWIKFNNHNLSLRRMCDTALRYFGYTRSFERI